MRRSRSLLSPVSALATAALVAVAAGCGASQSSEPVATNEVTMAKSYVFEPQVIQVEAGSTVTWTNDDNFTHTVRVDGQEDHEVDRGDSVSIRFDTPGTYHYVCTLHELDMDGDRNVWTSHSSSPAWHVEGGIPKVTRLNPTGAPDIESSGLFSGTEPASPAAQPPATGLAQH